MIKLIIPPDQAGYAVTDGLEVVSTSLDGGAARYRRDVLGAASKVNVQWQVGPNGYKYLRSFYRGTTISGSLPFEIDLILDEIDLTTHKCYFVPGTFALKQQSGLTYYVGATLEVYPNPVAETANDFVSIFNEFNGNILAFQYSEDLLNTIVNTLLPESL